MHPALRGKREDDHRVAHPLRHVAAKELLAPRRNFQRPAELPDAKRDRHVALLDCHSHRGEVERSSLYLFFGTTSLKAVEKFKDGLWEVDGISGERFRDPRNPDQLSFDILQPDFTPLERAFVDLASGRAEISLQVMCDHALRETIYKATHAKPVVDKLVNQHKLELVRTGKSYTERIYKLAAPTLF